MEPESFYKYLPIDPSQPIATQHAISNLLNYRSVFSTRAAFNDLFDSTINYILPSYSELKESHKKLKGRIKHEFKESFLGNDWLEKQKTLRININKELDKLIIYCVTTDPKNNLMWSHYANSHKGFCIEWDARHIKANKIVYQEEIAKIKAIDILNAHYAITNNEDISEQLLRSMNVKLSEWEYEKEYRVNLSKDSQHLIREKIENIRLVEFQPEWIKSIIFGYRTPQNAIDYITESLPSHINFKRIKIAEDKSSLSVVRL